ncbi:kelch-like ECH-associated protein 1 [Ciona intestinalis]
MLKPNAGVMSCKLRKKTHTSSSDGGGGMGKCPGRVIPSMNGDRIERFELKEYPNDSLRIINELRHSSLLCDVTIKLEYNGQKKKFSAHKLVLASCSPYFKAMFTGGCRERNMSEVNMREIHPDVFSKLLDFAYTSRILISEQCVLYIMVGACMLQMNHVVQICCKFLENQLDPSNCLGLAAFAEDLGCIDLKRKIEKYVCAHFEQVSQSEEFKTLSPCRLSKIIAADEIHVDCESQVYNAVLCWVQYNPMARQQYLKMLLEAVRCHSLTPGFLERQLQNCPVVNKEPRCREYLAHVFKELTLHKPVGHKPRAPDIGQVIYVAGGYLRHSLPYMECFHPEENMWLRLRDLPMPRSGIASCVVQGLFYAIGGRNNSPEGNYDSAACDRYNPMSDQWDHRSSMNVPRNRSSVGVIDNMVYAVGGSQGPTHHNSVERYDPELDTWTMVCGMKTKRIGVGCAVVNRMLYAVGGFDGVNRLSSVERYHPENDEWKDTQPMHTARSGAGVVALGNTIYAVGGYDGHEQLNSVEKYNVLDDTWQSVSRMKHRRSALAVTVHNGKIFALGGYDGHDFLSSVEYYDPAKNEWKEVTNMSSGRSGCGSAVGFQPCLRR